MSLTENNSDQINQQRYGIHSSLWSLNILTLMSNEEKGKLISHRKLQQSHQHEI